MLPNEHAASEPRQSGSVRDEEFHVKQTPEAQDVPRGTVNPCYILSPTPKFVTTAPWRSRLSFVSLIPRQLRGKATGSSDETFTALATQQRTRYVLCPTRTTVALVHGKACGTSQLNPFAPVPATVSLLTNRATCWTSRKACFDS